MYKPSWHSAEGVNDSMWLYRAAGYVAGSVGARVLSQRSKVGEKVAAFLDGLGDALFGRPLGRPGAYKIERRNP